MALGALGFLALVVFAHAPLLSAGLFAWDYSALLGAPTLPLAGSSLVLEAISGLPRPGAAALAWRIPALVVLLVIAATTRVVLARLLEPWLGLQPARAAGLVAALLVPLHPGAPAALADLAGQGELVGLALALGSAALFLRGRQTESDALTAASLVLLLVAGLGSPVARLFAAGLAGAEYGCVRRHRKRALRLRTAATTALAFGAAAWLPRVLGARAGGEPALSASLPEALRARVIEMVEELGRVATAAGGLGASGTLLSALLLVLALRPGLRAARNAPRLWSWLLGVFALLLAAALAWAGTRAGPGAAARGLPAIGVWSAGLALALTAQARPWRGYLVVALALGWAVLAHASARPWRVGSRVLARFHAEIEALAPPRDARVLVLDPPAVAGLPPLARDLGWLFHWVLDEGADESVFDARRVRGLTGPAFLTLASSDAFQDWRRSRMVVLASARAFGRADAGRRLVELPPARAAQRDPEPWRASLTYVPAEPLDPLALEQVRIVADLATPERDLERLAWRTRAGELGSLAGLVRERGGRRVAEFDLARSLAWRLAGSVRSLEVEKGSRSTIERGELIARAPEVPGSGTPVVRGEDWSFARPGPEAPGLAGARGVLALLDLTELTELELVLEPDPLDPTRLCARGAQGFVARAAGAPIAWTLEYRVGEHALYRTRGSVP